MATKAPNRYFDMKGNEYDYDYFVHCFATFGTLVAKANKIIPNGIDEEFISCYFCVMVQDSMLKPTDSLLGNPKL